jgi:hypothetical protein
VPDSESSPHTTVVFCTVRLSPVSGFFSSVLKLPLPISTDVLPFFLPTLFPLIRNLVEASRGKGKW